jgi:hypothetical protein
MKLMNQEVKNDEHDWKEAKERRIDGKNWWRTIKLGSWYGGEEEHAFDGFKQNHVFFSNKKI